MTADPRTLAAERQSDPRPRIVFGDEELAVGAAILGTIIGMIAGLVVGHWWRRR